MSTSWFCFALSLLGLAAPTTAGDGPAPTLDHSAPFLGHRLVLHLQGATPGAALSLLRSSAAAEVELPYGLLELDPNEMQVVETGHVSFNGEARFWIQLPSDPVMAEEECHFQVLVGTTDVPEEAVLSQAVHLRILGPRAYVEFRGSFSDAQPRGLDIVSVVHESIVGGYQLGPPEPGTHASGSGPAVFNRNYSRGAIIGNSNELILFDPFFGDVLAELPMERASGTLLQDASREHLFVLDGPAPSSGSATGRVLVVDMRSGEIEESLELHDLAYGSWAASPEGKAYLSARGDDDSRYLRPFDLESREFGAPVLVSEEPASGLRELTVVGDTVFAAYEQYDGPSQAVLARVDFGSAAPTVEKTTFLGFTIRVSGLTLVPKARRLWFSWTETQFPVAQLCALPLTPGAAHDAIELPNQTDPPQYLALRGNEAWAIARSADGDDVDRIWRAEDVQDPQWEPVDSFPCASSGRFLRSLRDRYSDCLVYTTRDCEESLVALHDPETGERALLPTGTDPQSLGVVSVPSKPGPASLQDVRGRPGSGRGYGDPAAEPARR